MGGQNMIRIEGVRIVETNKNYKELFHALFLFDLILSDGRLDKYIITERDIQIIRTLFIDRKLSSLDKYIQMTLRSFIVNKKQIIINMDGLRSISWKDNAKEVVEFIIPDRLRSKYILNIDYRDAKLRFGTENLISSKIFDMFPSTTNICISMGTIGGHGSGYIFDLFTFLEIISKSDTWHMIKIRERVKKRMRIKVGYICIIMPVYHRCNQLIKSMD